MAPSDQSKPYRTILPFLYDDGSDADPFEFCMKNLETLSCLHGIHNIPSDVEGQGSVAEGFVFLMQSLEEDYVELSLDEVGESSVAKISVASLSNSLSGNTSAINSGTIPPSANTDTTAMHVQKPTTSVKVGDILVANSTKTPGMEQDKALVRLLSQRPELSAAELLKEANKITGRRSNSTKWLMDRYRKIGNKKTKHWTTEFVRASPRWELIDARITNFN